MKMTNWICDICGKPTIGFEIDATRKKHIGGGHFKARLCSNHFAQHSTTMKLKAAMKT